MNTATLAAAATRFQFTLPGGLLVALQRALAPAASGVHGLATRVPPAGSPAHWAAASLARPARCG